MEEQSSVTFAGEDSHEYRWQNNIDLAYGTALGTFATQR